MNTFFPNLLPPVFANTAGISLGGSAVEIATDAASQAAFYAVLQEGVLDGSLPSVALLGARPWRVPTLLQPRADIVEHLKSAAALAPLRRATQDEARTAVSPDGRVYAVAGQISPEVPPTRQTSSKSGLETFRRNLEEAKTLLEPKAITIIEYRKLVALLNSIPTAAEMGEANLLDNNWQELFLEMATALVAATVRGIEIRYNDFSAIEQLVKRAMGYIGALQEAHKKEHVAGGGLKREEILSPQDLSFMRDVELNLAWQKFPRWGRWLMAKHYRLVKARRNPGALELSTKLLRDYNRRSDFFRVAFGLMALGIASKEDSDLDIVRLVVFKKEYGVEREPSGKVSPLEIQAAHEWRHPGLPKGVVIYVWGLVSMRPRF